MNIIKKIVFLCVLAAALSSIANFASAAEGGGSSATNDLIANVDAITVNLVGSQYIQVEMKLKLAKPEVGEKVKLYMPVIRHKMILLLTSKDAAQLGPIEGKQKLLQESKDAVNQALELTEKDGVTDVLFSSFIIQ